MGSGGRDDLGAIGIPGRRIARSRIADYVGVRRCSPSWFTIDQDRINLFAEATLDYQFIHVDPARAADSAFGSTIAHGFLTLSLLPKLLEPIMLIPENISMGLNYGLDRVRFPHPVPVNSRVRACSTLLEASEDEHDRLRMRSEVLIEIQGIEKPAVVAESIAMWLFGDRA